MARNSEKFVGSSCKYGHDGLRYVGSGTCVQCQQLSYRDPNWRLKTSVQIKKRLPRMPRPLNAIVSRPEVIIRADATAILTAQLERQRERWGFI